MTRMSVSNRGEIIITQRIILLAITAIFVLSSCTPSVVRNSYDFQKKKKNQTEAKKEKIVSPEDKLKEFEEKVIEAKSNETQAPIEEVSTTPQDEATEERRLPTLREQMQMIATEQVVIKNKVNTLQNDVIEIKYALEEIKSSLRNGQSLPKSKVVAGEPLESDENVEEASAPKSSDPAVILPDESEKKPQKTITKPKTKPASTSKRTEPLKTEPVAYKPKAEPQKQEEAIAPKLEITEALNSFAKKDYQAAITQLTDVLKTSKDPTTKTEANYWLGENYLAISDYNAALNHFSSVAKNPKSEKTDDAHAKIAECLLKTGQTNEAKDVFRKLISKYPQSEYVPRARKYLQQL